MSSFLKRINQTKSISDLNSEANNENNGFKRTLGPFNLTSLGIGAIVGAGIFVITGQVAAQYAGPAIVFSFIFAAFACVCAGFCYAELSSMIPVSGSAYSFAYAALGEFVAWMIGWNLILQYLFGVSTVALGWSGYVVSFFRDIGIIIPEKFCTAPYNVPAILVLSSISILIYFGIKQSSRINNVIVILKLTIIVMFIVYGLSFIKLQNLVPFVPANTGEFGRFGWSGVLRGAGVIFFAYIGFDSISAVAQECKNPKRDIPIGIIAALSICTLIYILMSLVLTGIVKYTQLSVPDPMAVGINATGAGSFVKYSIKIGAIAGLTSVILVQLLSIARIVFCISKNGLLPKKLTAIHSRFGTPYVSTIVFGLFSVLLVCLFPLNILGELVSLVTLFIIVIVCFCVLILRYKQPDLARSFKVPFFPLLPVLGILFSVAQMIALPFNTWLLLLAWMFLGFVIYISLLFQRLL